MRKTVCTQLSISKGSIFNSQPDNSYLITLTVNTYCRECAWWICVDFSLLCEGSQTMPKSALKLFLMSNSNNILFLYRTFNPRILSLYKHLFNSILRISVFDCWENSTRLKNMEIKIEHRILTHNGLWIRLFPPNHSRKIKNYRGFSRINN